MPRGKAYTQTLGNLPPEQAAMTIQTIGTDNLWEIPEASKGELTEDGQFVITKSVAASGMEREIKIPLVDTREKALEMASAGVKTAWWDPNFVWADRDGKLWRGSMVWSGRKYARERRYDDGVVAVDI